MGRFWTLIKSLFFFLLLVCPRSVLAEDISQYSYTPLSDINDPRQVDILNNNFARVWSKFSTLSTGGSSVSSVTMTDAWYITPQSVTASFTLSTQTVVIASPSVPSVYILPACSGVTGKMLFVKLVTTNTATLQPSGSDLVDSTGSFVLRGKNEFVTLYSDGVGWNTVSRSPAVGSITEWSGSTTTIPSGWISCDGSTLTTTGYPGLFAIIGYTFGGSGSNFILPDLRGINVMGAGTTNRPSGKDANGNSYGTVLGTYYQDQAQGHWHKTLVDTSVGNLTHGAGHENTDGQASGGSALEGNYAAARTPMTDGTNGTPRTGTYTRGPALALNFIIKY
jgi:microcystin-dependent protein